MTEIFVSEPHKSKNPESAKRRVLLQDDGYYWFLYWYFEAASLPPRKHELIDLYAHAELFGYQLQRFIEELDEARTDVLSKPEQWSVRVGWNGETMSKETERYESVERSRMVALIDDLLSIAREAHDQDLKLFSIGD
ncbi:MAG: hypothetical protein Q8T11_05415 [Elusimicrobiota bacterium]|nr:hypothetical protein [Elusimicrobiota bacterium]